MNPASHRPPSLAELQRQVELFNRMAPSGSAVTVRKDSGEIVGTKTRSEAWVLSGHSAVVLLDGISGGYDLNRISLIPHEKVLNKSARAEGGKSEAIASAANGRDPRKEPRVGDIIQRPHGHRELEVCSVDDGSISVYGRDGARKIPMWACSLSYWPTFAKDATVIRVANSPAHPNDSELSSHALPMSENSSTGGKA